MGLFGGGNSSSNQTTNNYDKRVAVQDGIGITGDANSIFTSSNTTTNITDSGIVSRGLTTVDKALSGGLDTVGNTVDRALKSVDLSSANQAQGFSQLLGAAESLWNKSEGLIGQTQKSVADAYMAANTDAKGSLDNKTIIVLAVAGAVALFAMKKG